MSDWPKWLQILDRFGVTLAVLIWLGVYITPKIVTMATAIEQHVAHEKVQIVLTRAICRNTAKTELQVQFCDFGETSP